MKLNVEINIKIQVLTIRNYGQNGVKQVFLRGWFPVFYVEMIS